jgi:hypothetical protein
MKALTAGTFAHSKEYACIAHGWWVWCAVGVCVLLGQLQNLHTSHSLCSWFTDESLARFCEFIIDKR